MRDRWARAGLLLALSHTVMTSLRKAVGLAFIAMLVAGGSGAFAQSSTGSVTGTVTTPAADGQPSVMPGVTLTLSCTGTDETQPLVGISDDQGRFEFKDVPAAVCSLVAELQGFKAVTKTL